MTMNSSPGSAAIITGHGYRIVPQEMPYPLAEMNAYLVESDGGWSVIDVGIDTPHTRARWESALAETGIAFGRIEAIYVTHCHPDHLGAAKWLQRMSGAPVYMLDAEIETARKFFFYRGDPAAFYMRAAGPIIREADFPEEQTPRLISDYCEKVFPLFPEPEHIVPLREGDTIRLGGADFTVMRSPGHSDAQTLFWSPERRHLFLADVMPEAGYLHFTDWPNTFLNDPLGEHLSHLDTLEGLESPLCWPGHGSAFSGFAERIAKLRRRHARILESFYAAAKEPVTAGKLYHLLGTVPDDGPFAQYPHFYRVLVGEARGYLNRLAAAGSLVTWLDGGKRYYAHR
jgi:glyoxylase-like metal-dependent hydrolase (beta-lactamase superfamily II)